ncbi:MAG: hypothetical protein JO011_03405 [Ktedonobacteraceae bacterium]|nr:hypothetical protein [Ktedonobacteraceae bacterium]
MNNQDKHFWFKFKEDELKDAGTRRVLETMRNIYSVNEDDRQSVQHAWQRISSSMEQERTQLRKHASRLNGLHNFSPSFSLMDPGSNAPIERSSMRRRFEVLVALGVIFLLVGSMIGIFAYRHSMSSSQAGKHTQSPASQRLGSILGPLSLGMVKKSFEERGVVGVFIPRNNNQSLAFYCRHDNCWVMFESTLARSEPTVAQIFAWGRFQGKTAEGFKLGMSLDQFNSLYKSNQFQRKTFTLADFPVIGPRFPIYVPRNDVGIVVSVRDTYGTTLWVLFSQYRQATEIGLQSGITGRDCCTARPTPSLKK